MTTSLQEIINWSKSSKGLELQPCEGTGLVQAGEEKAQRGSCCCLEKKYLIGGCGEDRGRHFSEAEADIRMAKGNSHELQDRRFHLGIRKTF